MSHGKSPMRPVVGTALAGGGALGLSFLFGEAPSVIDSAAVLEVAATAETAGHVGGGLLVAGAVARGVYVHSRAYRWRQILRTDGWAARHDVDDVLGRRGIRQVAEQVRPSLEKGRRTRKPCDLDYGQPLGTIVSGYRPARGKEAFVGFEHCLAIVAPPGSGKTALMLHQILDAPGGALVTSTKTDVYQLTHELRAERGPVALFNPQGLGGIASTLRWNPLVGCEDYVTAAERAAALVSGTKGITGMQEASWAQHCTELLAKYLMAARLGGKDIHQVAEWLSQPDDETAVRVLKHFELHEVARSLEAEMRSPADRMKGSIWALARGALQFTSHPVVSAAVSAGVGETFDARRFALEGGTLYLLGDDKDESIAPLLTALTDYVYREVVRTAQATLNVAGEPRLDPPFGFFLDEVTKITPVPLAKWAADSRGHGIYITFATQSYDQLRERYGRDDAGTIAAIFARAVLGGLKNLDDLEDLSKLVGMRQVAKVSEGQSTGRGGFSRSRNTSPEKERIIAPEDLARLPRGHALVLIGTARACVVRYELGQQRAVKEREELRRRREHERGGRGSGEGAENVSVLRPEGEHSGSEQAEATGPVKGVASA